MKKILTILLLMAIALPGFSNDRKPIMSTAYENGTFIPKGPVVYGQYDNGIYPNGTVIPGADNYFDYVTNGKNMYSMWALGDTMIVSYFGADQTDPTGATSRVAYYVVSLDKGVTWGAPLAFTTLPRRSAYPDIAPYIGTLGRNVGLSGRLYTIGGASRGGSFTEAFFGLGSITPVNLPYEGRDFFSQSIGNGVIGGVFSVPDGITEDSLFYITYDNNTTTYGTRTLIAAPPNDIDSNARYTFTANDAGNDLTALWWDSEDQNITGRQALKYRRSTDGGTTWGTIESIHQSLALNGVINGDTCGPWFGIDGEYKPGTSDFYASWSTMYPTGSGLTPGDPQGNKILFWNANLNGGVPVEIAGRSNMNTLADTNLLFPAITLNGGGNNGGLSVGVTPVSHPSIGFGTVGSATRIFCTFSGYQPLPDTLDGFVMNDIYYSFSDDGGLTWTTPQNLTNTPDWDELYPTVSPSGNTNEFFVHYQATRGPGSQSFTNTQVPTYVVHEIFDIVQTPPVSVQNISNEIPDGFSLKQNFPNPFNPSTSIQFNIPTSSLVTLKVYDVTGKEVATLVNSQRLAAGSFQYDFNASNLSSGMYFYTLSTDNFRETKKMMLIK